MTKKFVFIGDSITWWSKSEEDPIGSGYVRLLHDYLKVRYPSIPFEIYNQGISGNRVTDLQERWETDVLSLQPDFLSISIGINDVWRQIDSPDMEQVYPDQFKRVYENLLKQVKEKTSARIILMEPTVIEEDIQSEGNQKLKAYTDIIHRLSEEYEAILVPTHQACMEYLGSEYAESLTVDGVHMSSVGNMLMATAWVNATKSLFDNEV